MILEAECRRCDEVFNPADEKDLVHLVREDGTECGGWGRMLGMWGVSPDEIYPFGLVTIRSGTRGRQRRVTTGWLILKWMMRGLR